MRKMLVTGGAGFIGSNFIHHILSKYDDIGVINLDKLTYAGNPNNLHDVADDRRYEFVRGDICNSELVDLLAAQVDMVVNFAAESHVDRSIMDADAFIRTNALGVYTLLDAARRHEVGRFLQVSTDEVYGSLGPDEPAWTEVSPPSPRNPYSAAKASGDMMARSFAITYGLPVVITRASNNIGPYQYPEKRVPLFVTNAMDDVKLPVYGQGGAVRDHLYVTDHCEAIDLVLHEGEAGEIYNVGADNEADGMDVTRKILELLEKPDSLIEHVEDRPGHDMRYALDTTKLKALGWQQKHGFEDAMRLTAEWYVANESWWRPIKEGEDYQAYYRRNYANR